MPFSARHIRPLRNDTALLPLFGIIKRNGMACALSFLWDEATETKYLLNYLI
jgi:hypothetical protein